MKRKVKLLLSIITILLFVTGCEKQPEKQPEMPEVVFIRKYMEGEDTGKFWCIDKEGKVITGRDKKFALSPVDKYLEVYKQNVENYEVIGSVDIEELQEKYQILCEIVNGDNNIERYYDLCIDVIIDEEIWRGYCYDKQGVLTLVLLYCEDEILRYNQDGRALELSEWLDEVFGEEHNGIGGRSDIKMFKDSPNAGIVIK